MFWPDLMAVCCRRVMAVHSGDMKGLQAIWRVKIGVVIFQNMDIEHIGPATQVVENRFFVKMYT